MHRLVSLLAAVGTAMLLLALPVQAQDVIKIAAGAPLTGPLAKQGQEVANAVKLAVEEWNAMLSTGSSRSISWSASAHIASSG